MKSKLFRQLFTVVSAIIIFSGIIAILIGNYSVKHYFLKSKLGELEPKTKSLAEQYGKSEILEKIDAKSLMLDGIIKVYNINREQLVEFEQTRIPFAKEDFSVYDNIDESLSYFIDRVFSGASIKEITELDGLNNDFIIIGEPIKNSGKITGAFFCIKPVEEYDATLNGFYYALIISMTMAFLLIIVLLYFFSKSFVKPINEMKNSSVSMANGNFSIRVKENEKNEIGELATAINFLASSLEEKQALAAQLEQTRRDYVANVSHELRTPVSAIRAFSETLSDGMINDDIQKNKYYGMILQESVRLEKLINDMLDLSRLQSGKTALKKSFVDMASILKNVVVSYQQIADDMDINLDCNINFNEIPEAFSNSDRITQVIIILLDNAIKYTPSDGIVTIDASWDENVIKISVRDTGIGIADEDIPFVFERFYKSDKSHSTKGTGLGLSIAKEIITRLDEKILVESELNKGTAFTFTVHRN